jgi:hypothetical protein
MCSKFSAPKLIHIKGYRPTLRLRTWGNETGAYSERVANSSHNFLPLSNNAPHQNWQHFSFPFLSRGLQNKKVTCCLSTEMRVNEWHDHGPVFSSTHVWQVCLSSGKQSDELTLPLSSRNYTIERFTGTDAVRRSYFTRNPYLPHTCTHYHITPPTIDNPHILERLP